MSIERKICQAIDIITNKAVNDANFDKTILATVLEYSDAATGKYKVKYQDSTFYAYSDNKNIIYSKGARVYVLMPGNDLNKEKVILGSESSMGTDYVIDSLDKDKYEEIGSDLTIGDKSFFSLISWKNERKTLYEYNSKKNEISLKEDTDLIKQFLQDSNFLKVQMTVRTDLTEMSNANYGLDIFVKFKKDKFKEEENEENTFYTKKFRFDIDQMIGNPFKFFSEVNQTAFFEIDGENFERIEKIEIFSENFKLKEESEIPNIFIGNISILGANRIAETDLRRDGLSIVFPDGNKIKESTKFIHADAKVRINSMLLPDLSKVQFFWFQEDLTITRNSKRFHPYGGIGWRCLNEWYNEEKESSGKFLNEDSIIEYKTDKTFYDFKDTDCPAKENRIKCVAIYNNKILEKISVIENPLCKYEISIESDSGCYFTDGFGQPNLICHVNPKQSLQQDSNSNYIYVWSYIDENKQQVILENDLETDENKTNKMIVKNDKIFNINVNDIFNEKIFKCSVTLVEGDQSRYIGIGQIVLHNKKGEHKGYSVVIPEGNRVYKYDTKGLNPFGKNERDKIKNSTGLTFIIYDENGNELSKTERNKCKIKWIIPMKNTLLHFSGYNLNKEKEFEYIKDCEKLNYSVDNTFNRKKANNTIRLEIEYKNKLIKQQTNFSFLKEGDPGTNGTEYIHKIVFKNEDKIIKNPAIIKRGDGLPQFNYNKMECQLWKNGSIIDIDKNQINILSILKNEYGASKEDESNLTIGVGTNNLYTVNCKEVESGESTPTANILKSVLTDSKNKRYFTLIPFTYIELKNPDYSIDLNPSSGFSTVVYSADGKYPEYDDSTPFEILLSKAGEEINLNDFTFEWNVLGSILDKGEYKEANNLLIKESDGDTIEKNKAYVIPSEDYDGYCVNNSVVCTIYKGKEEIGFIKIPIILTLNTYGKSAINEWDGNSVLLNGDKDILLSPQIGAGSKNEANLFTGLLMGKVKETKDNEEDLIGLVGYSGGQRSIFLDANSGKAEFGINNSGRIIIDPDPSKGGSIYGGDYKKKDKDNPGSGMWIDLKTPSINYGNENFSVDWNGHLIAKGGGSIAGWEISDNSLTKGLVKISSDNSKLENNAFEAGDTFSVDFNGNLKATSGNIANLIIETESIHTKDKKWNAEEDDISTAKGFFLGKHNEKHILQLGNNFEVNDSGEMTARSGKIANWSITKNNLSCGEMSLGSNGIKMGEYFSVGPTGLLTATGGHIAGWELTANSIQTEGKTWTDPRKGLYLGSSGIYLGNSFWVDVQGNLTAKSGQIGGWKITENSLQGGSIGKDGKFHASVTINSDGSLSSLGSSGWSINSDGSANFQNASIGGSSIVAGGSVGSGIAGGNITNGSIPFEKFDGDVYKKVGNIAAEKIKAASINVEQLNGEDIAWRDITYVYTINREFYTQRKIRVLSDGGEYISIPPIFYKDNM